MQEEVAVAKSAQSVETAPPKVVMSLKDVAVTFNGRTAVRDATFDVSSNKIT